MLVSTFFVQAIFSTAAFAFPSSKTRFDSRAVLGTASATLQDSPVTSSDTGISVTDAFAGAIVHSDSDPFVEITASFVIPHITPDGNSDFQGAIADIHIGNTDCGDGGEFTAGLLLGLTNRTIASFEAFATASSATGITGITGFELDEGDSVTVSITVSSATSATAVITNNSKGKTVSNSLSASTPVCLTEAFFLFGLFGSSGGSTPLIDFDKFTYTDVSATTDSGAANLKEATVVDFEQNNKTVVITKVEHSKVRFEHV